MNKLLIVLVFAIGLALTGCAQNSEQEPASVPEIEETAPESEPEAEPEETFTLPDGYPKVVDIATIPDQMRWAFEDDGTGQAVAVAEGVWAHLTPGASMEDAVNTLSYDGYCASIKALEREHFNGESVMSTCW